MAVKITSVEKGSAGSRKGIKSGDTLISINDHEIFDVLDYRFYADTDDIYLRFCNAKGRERVKHIRHCDGADSLGLNFDTYLMDKKQQCRNKCVFCFVDQMPPGMRDSLYFKDDDSRLSFFFGNYITLTAISEREVQRIIDMHISPINISVHTMDPALRVKLMGNPYAGEVLSIIDRFSDAGIQMNTQLVLCPGLNDGKALEYSLDELSKRYPAVQSIAAVPVGLTAWREGLYPLKPYDRQSAAEVLDIIDAFNEHFAFFNGGKLCYPADEFYIKAERPVPDVDFYDDFSQLENGVGMWALLRATFREALTQLPEPTVAKRKKVYIATGEAAYPLLAALTEELRQRASSVDCKVVCVKNHFFGESVTVAGLITGKDLLAKMREEETADGYLLLTSAMLKSADEPIFLDDITVSQVEEQLGVSVVVVPETDGRQLLAEILGL